MTQSKHTSPLDGLFTRQASGPLAGIVIADFSRVLAGPYCTMLLADMGATVIKVESPAGDETRTWKPPVHEDQSTYYLSINRNKSSIALDFRDETDLETARAIAGRADVLVENFKPGGLERFGLDYDAVSHSNPDVIYASVTGFGTKGGAALPGYDLLVQALSGLMSLTGAPDSPAYRAGVAVFDVITGLHTAIGILSALHERGNSGRGQHVEANLMSSALSGMVNQTAGYVLSGQVPTRMGNEHPSIYPYEPFRTAEGDIILAIGNDRQFLRLCAVLGAEHLPEDPRFAAAADRSHHRGELRPILQELLAARSAAEWFDVLTDAGLPCAPINDVQGGIEFAQRLGLEPVVQVGHGDRTLPGIRNPLTFSKTPVSYDLIPPGIDEDRDAILDWLNEAT
ncbi:CaiB/BaiF CoA transferase family protein [Corynebacterium comes]|uniref:Succinyl-CoA:(R)-benzylsuccinate CoA-transferase subunit BbsF n=1 Tax=Corynebacterium comes TaxID=2675218 RepID=A0A6B8W4H5_9CORY|nr:CoA transferase [Corynebacterium comes]QGU05826.1 Succinyl-CoA:(R)-benzylsuccinate CoA-transferase subunit BbsF [Corynebacterium comes]